MTIAPTTLDLSCALFIPPEADRYVEIVLNYWDYAFNMAESDDLVPPNATPEVEEAERILQEKYPLVVAAIDKAIIKRSLKRDFKW